MVAPSSTFSPLRYRDFRLFWLSNLVSGCGIAIQTLALGWVIAKLPHAPLRLSAYGVATLAPTLLLAIFGGTLADRVNRRVILIITQSVLMLIALVLSALTYF